MSNKRKKIEKLDFIKIKNFCTSKDIIKNVNKQFTEWEKILANHISDEGLIFRIYRQLFKTQQQEDNPIFKGWKHLTFLQRYTNNQ